MSQDGGEIESGTTGPEVHAEEFSNGSRYPARLKNPHGAQGSYHPPSANRPRAGPAPAHQANGACVCCTACFSCGVIAAAINSRYKLHFYRIRNCGCGQLVAATADPRKSLTEPTVRKVADTENHAYNEVFDTVIC
ncbi:hypothetical protein EVAR_63017_1 [Eumeta japonica]|uniref:Uncharacterized protein n=1 Tax=Eumeta variegata TaxID=151549 RepID=A0A4C1YXE3_EUMVA|nr:hypothetical protein EVAR_63017_1 [Eumeta japonica]